MEIYENINRIIEARQLSKREFAHRLMALEPRLKSTGEIPTEKTIYKYLNGTIAIRVELLPFIAQALNITEQELFLTSSDDKIKFYRKMIQYASQEELEILKKSLYANAQIETILEHPTNKPLVDDIEGKRAHIVSLLHYAPIPLLDVLLLRLQDIKHYTRELSKIG